MRHHPIPIALTLVSALASPVMARQAESSWITPFARIDEEGGGRSLVVVDPSGAPLTSLPFDGKEAFAGGGRLLAWNRATVSGSRSIAVLDVTGRTHAGLEIAADRRAVLGESSLALHPVAPHQPGTRHEIEFVALDGSGRNSVARDGALLFDVVAHAGGFFAAHSREPNGSFRVDVYDASGQPRFAFETTRAAVPLLAIAVDGSRAIVAINDFDDRDATLHWLDGEGNELRRTSAATVQWAAFDAAGARLLLASRGELRVLDAATGAPRLEAAGFGSLANGTPMAFVGQELAFVATERDGASVHVIAAGESQGSEAVLPLPFAALESDAPVLGIERSSRGYVVTTRNGRFEVSK